MAAKARILVVDDEKEIRSLYSAVLEQEGYEVVSAADGKEALAKVEEQGFHLVITDLEMSEMDGKALLKALREGKGVMPVIVMTGKLDGALINALMVDFDKVLIKPIELLILKTVVAKILSGS